MIPGVEHVLALVTSLNGNKVFWGIAMIMMNMGSRFVLGDLNKVHEKMLMMDLIKKLVLFCMFFVGSRDVIISLVLTFVFSIVVNGLLNSNSRFSMVPKNIVDQAAAISPPVIPEPDYMRAKEVVLKYEAAHGDFASQKKEADGLNAVAVYKQLLQKINHRL